MILDTGENGLILNVSLINEIDANSIRDTVDVSNSFKLYLGSIDVDSLDQPDSLGRQSMILMKFSSNGIKESGVCTDTTMLKSVMISLVASAQMELPPEDPITYDVNSQILSRDMGLSETALAWFIPEIDSILPWDESDDIIIDNEGDIFSNDIFIVNKNELKIEQIILNNSMYKLNFQLDSLSFDLSEKICNQYNDFGIWLEETSHGRLTEFFSTDYYSSTIVPSIHAVVDEEQLTSDQLAKYKIETINSDYFTDLDFSTQLDLDQPFYGMIRSEHQDDPYSNIDLPSSVMFQDTSLKLDIFNFIIDTLTIFEDSSGIIDFTFHDISFFRLLHTIGDVNPANDNWNPSDSTGSENNGLYDIGELFYDCGLDRICDLDEPGYNPNGTENNFYWDLGEIYFDCGLDSLCDEFEEGFDEDTNPDPEGDNFLPDPSMDDWNSEDSTGTENNGIYDLGEPFQDFGYDWIPDSILIDTTGLENNGLWDHEDLNGNGKIDDNENYELWIDSGVDGLWNYQEPDYNPYGSEGNNIYDYGELFEDCGIDSLCNVEEEGFSEFNLDPYGDDKNVDPLGDNWNVEDSTNTEKNNQFDWEDSNNNGIFDLDDLHEEFMDWGIDQTPDSLILIINPDSISDGENNFVIYDTIYTAPESANYSGYFLKENLGSNLWRFNLFSESDTIYEQPALQGNDDFTIWPSSIKRVDGNYEITISLFTKVPISGFEFILDHIPFYKITTEVVEKDIILTNPAIEFYSDEKLIQDVSIYPINQKFNNLDFENQFFITYGDAIYSNVKIPGIIDFLDSYPEAIISEALLHLFIDTTHQNYYIHPNGIKITINRLNQYFDGQGDPDITPLQSLVIKDQNSVEFTLKNELQYYLENEIDYHGYILTASRETFNFSNITFHIDTDSIFAPSLEVLWVK